MAQRVRLRRVLVEGVVIVGSILLAFAIDASWDRRQEQAETNRQLEALIQELRQTREALSTELRGVESSGEGSAAILELMRRPGRSVTPEELAAQLRKSFNVGLFTAAHPVLTPLLGSGELVELPSETLLPRLARWQDALEHLRLDSRHLERNREETIFDRSVTLGIPIDLESPSPSLLGILDDGGMEAAFTTRAGRASRLAASYAEAIEMSEQIILDLEQVLAGG